MSPNYPKLDPLDWQTIQPHIDALLDAELTATDVRPWLGRWSDLEAVLDEASTQIYREISENTADQEADARFKHWVSDIFPAYARAAQALKNKLLAVQDYRPTAETAQLMKRLRVEADLFRSENVPLQSQLSLLGKRYQEITGGLEITWEGEQKTIPQAEVLLSSPNRRIREGVWRKAIDGYLNQRSELNHLFLEMLPLRRQLATNAGFDNFRSYQWQVKNRFDYTPEDAYTFHDAIEHEVVPFCTELYTEYARQLGLSKLRPWETGIAGSWTVTVDPFDAPLQPFGDVAELEKTAHRIFQQVDPVLGGYFDAMRDGYLDLDSRPNKAQGGYCSSFPVSGQPYIFMNAAGTHDNVSTLLHEGGHAFHVVESMAHQSLIWNYNAPMEFCEVASMSMELLTLPYWSRAQGGFYEATELKRAIRQELTSSLFFLPYMAVVDSLQHWLYVEAPVEVSADEIDQKWSELWDRFLPGIDYTGLQAQKETGWHRKGHIFGVPFYYIEYGLAQLGAWQIWRNALNDQAKAVADYRQALAAGYTRPLPELFELAGARFAFDRRTVGDLVSFIRQQLELMGT